MLKTFLPLISMIFILCAGFSQSCAQDVESKSVGAELLDLDDPRLELWYGTELDPLRLPGLVWMDGETSLADNAFGRSGNITFPVGKVVNSKMKTKKKPVQFRGGGESKGSFAFAEPFDFNVWILVKWTAVVLILAGIATFFLRGKFARLPMLPSSREMKLVESLVVDQRSRLHLVAIGGERFLVATDLTGVKSTTLIPNWNLNDEINESLTLSGDATNNSTPIPISEAG